jgi:4-carboxymuconolactone decarboxylase
MKPRLALLSPTELTVDQTALYQSLTGGARAKGKQHFSLVDSNGGLVGPFNALLTNPAIGNAIQALGSALRFGGSLTPIAREAIILVVANYHRSDFEWEAHLRIARSVGLSESLIGAIKLGDGSPALGLAGINSAEIEDASILSCITVAKTLLQSGDLSDSQFAEAGLHLNEGSILEVAALVSYYGLLATIMRMFRVDEQIPSDEQAQQQQQQQQQAPQSGEQGTV